MTTKTTPTRLTSGRRLARGLKYSTVGPLDVTRGALGVGASAVGSSAAWLRDHYSGAKLRSDLESAQEAVAGELAAAQDAVARLPRRIRQARAPRRGPRPWVLGLAFAGLLGVGAVTWSIVRRSSQPEPSPLPPSVEVTPKP